jgi:hypothetical protein
MNCSVGFESKDYGFGGFFVCKLQFWFLNEGL